MSAQLRHLLARQEGLITLEQAASAGLSARAVQHRVRSGAWMRIHPRLYLVGGHPLTDGTAVRAAGMWIGDAGAVSGVAAAWWHGLLPGPPPLIEVSVPHGTRRRPPDGIRIRRRDLDVRDLVGIRGIWVTAMPLTVLETAVRLDDGAAFLDRALQRRVSFEQLHAAFCRTVNAKGAPAMRRLLVAAADRADSAAERVLIGLLRAEGFTGWARAISFGPYEIDVGFPDVKVAIEVDGWAWHVDVDRFRTDRRKQNALVAAGWTVLRFTWQDLQKRPTAVVAEIKSALARAA
jgi:very-short-patch-repair endonuclease